MRSISSLGNFASNFVNPKETARFYAEETFRPVMFLFNFNELCPIQLCAFTWFIRGFCSEWT